MVLDRQVDFGTFLGAQSSENIFSARSSVIFEIYIFYGIIKIDQLINQAIDLVETRPPCVREVQ